MLHHLLYADVISFFATRKCQKSKQSMKIFNIEGENLLNDLRNLNEIFRNDKFMIMLKVTKNWASLSLSLSLSLENTFSEKLQGIPPVFLGLKCSSTVPSSLYLDIDKTLRAWKLCRSSVVLWRIRTSFFAETEL